MGILNSMAEQQTQQQSQQQSQQQPQQQPQAQTQGGDMGQMYQFLLENAMKAISQNAEQRIKEKGPIDGTADLAASAMVANLQAAQQNGKSIPPQLMVQLAKDVIMHLLQQMGVPEDQVDEIFGEIIFKALEKFGDMSDGMLSPEEEQQYVEMINKISQLEQQRMGGGGAGSTGSAQGENTTALEQPPMNGNENEQVQAQAQQIRGM